MKNDRKACLFYAVFIGVIYWVSWYHYRQAFDPGLRIVPFNLAIGWNNHSALHRYCKIRQQCTGKGELGDSLRQDLDGTTPKPLMTDSTNAILGNDDPSIPTAIASRSFIAQAQFRLLAKGKRTSQTSDDPTFVDNRVCCTHPTSKIGFELLHWQFFWYEVEGG